MSLLRAAATVGGLTLVSRVLGFLRDLLFAAALGAGPVADAFFVAFKLPNFFRRLFAEGAFSAAFVPLYNELSARQGQAAARAFAEQALALLLTAVLGLVVVMQAAMPWVMHLLAPGFVGDESRFALAVRFSIVTFPYLVFISLVALMAGVLNALGRFAAPAATPILLNLGLIAAALWPAGDAAGRGLAQSWGLLLAGMAQFLYLAWTCGKAGVTLSLPRPRLSPKTVEMLKLMLPAAIGAGAAQINLVVDLILGSLLPAGSISYLFYADRLNQLPLGVIGVAVGTALLPLLSRQIAAGEREAALASQNRAIELVLLLTLPAAIGLVMLAEPIVAVLFERGAFGPLETARTAGALALYSLGLPAYVLIKALTPGFYARKDTGTPLAIALFCIGLNILLSLVLMDSMLHFGLALATALSAVVNAAALAVVLIRRGDLQLDQRLWRGLRGMAVAGAAMGLVLWGLLQLIPGDSVGGLALLLMAGAVVYVGGTHFTRAADWSRPASLLGREH
ncbi:MAG: murein biosynthesis integral membrane protein MurJ [Alphaproteobacteria bacterium]|nr:murein biosynthesis integral membrane protein MurJ [Alphaproteobacteria bacterium]